MDIQKFLVSADKICDYIPFVSTVTNFVDIFQKCIAMPLFGKSPALQNHYFTHLNQKSLARCIVLLIPGSNLFVGLHDHAKYQEKLQEKVEAARRDALRQDIVQQTKEAKAEADFLEDTFIDIDKFIRNDPELKAKYEECRKNTIISTPEQSRGEPVSEPDAEAWRTEMLRKAYYDNWKRYFDEFMSKNPEFHQLFTEKYNAYIASVSKKSMNDID